MVAVVHGGASSGGYGGSGDGVLEMKQSQEVTEVEGEVRNWESGGDDDGGCRSEGEEGITRECEEVEGTEVMIVDEVVTAAAERCREETKGDGATR